jgi:subfamily B ATP-binding cassette protein MsbA
MFLFLGALALILMTDWRLAAFMLVLVPLLMVFTIYFGRRLRRFSVDVQDKLATATTVLEEAIAGVPVIKSFQAETYENKRYAASMEKSWQASLQRIRLAAIFSPLVTFFLLCITVATLWFGGREVLAGRLTIGQLVVFLILTMMLANAIGQIAGVWARFQHAIGASRRIFEILDTKPEVTDVPGARKLGQVRGRITLEGVWFSYEPEARDRYALRDISLDIEPGEVLALVGPSGAGKSTLINLIPRFYDPTQGTISIDGNKLRLVDVKSLRRQIALVPQDTYLFGGTVYENLLYGKQDASEAEVIGAARAANAHGFIEALPQGYATVVGERGVRLSGGQRQRISIARALLKDPRVLLLDEATSSLDSESEALVQEAMERSMTGRTSIVIAHRLSTIQYADRIAVLDAGRLVELGSHDRLLSAGGLYERLYRIQFEGVGSLLDESAREPAAS